MKGVEDMSTEKGVWVLLRGGDLMLHEGAASSEMVPNMPYLELFDAEGTLVVRYLDWIGCGDIAFRPQMIGGI